MTKQEEEKLFNDTIDRVQYDLGTDEEIARMSVRELVMSISGLDRNSVKYRLHDYELKIRTIREQHKLNETIIEKQHELNKAMSKRQNYTVLIAAVITGIIGLAGVILGVKID